MTVCMLAGPWTRLASTVSSPSCVYVDRARASRPHCRLASVDGSVSAVLTKPSVCREMCSVERSCDRNGSGTDSSSALTESRNRWDSRSNASVDVARSKAADMKFSLLAFSSSRRTR